MAAPRPTDQAELAAIEALIRQQRHAEGLGRAERVIARNPRSAAGYSAAVRCLIPSGRLARAAELSDRGLRVAPADDTLNLLKGIIEHRLGQSAQAVERLSRLIARRPSNEVEASFALAEALHRAGRREELDALVAKGGAWLNDERAIVFSARTIQRNDRAQAVSLLESAARGACSPLLKRIAGFEAVRMLDADGRYAEALELARFVHRETTPTYDVGALEADVEAQRRLAAKGRAWFEPKGPAAATTAFVVGMPRSGTTLLEQMLDRHPRIAGIGEYEGAFAIHESLVGLGVWPNDLRSLQPADAARLAAEYLEGAVARRRAGADWTFDKTLNVWRLLPAVAAVLPGSAFIHITRDARDTAISMHLSNFHPRSWGFTASLDTIRRVIALERALVPQMAALLGLRLVHVRYEDLVAEPEREIRRVLDAMGVPFDPAVLAPEQNARTVLTLSYEQVRRPINRSSIGRWRNYAPAFDASWDALA
jgi:tetratricopeptide (TPR) repeat protein